MRKAIVVGKLLSFSPSPIIKHQQEANRIGVKGPFCPVKHMAQVSFGRDSPPGVILTQLGSAPALQCGRLHKWVWVATPAWATYKLPSAPWLSTPHLSADPRGTNSLARKPAVVAMMAGKPAEGQPVSIVLGEREEKQPVGVCASWGGRR